MHLDGTIFDSGRLTVDGAADFLSEPHFGMNVDIMLKDMQVDDVVPVTGRFNVQLRKGTISSAGHVEYSPVIKEAKLTDLFLQGCLSLTSAKSTAKPEVGVAETARHSELNHHPEGLLRSIGPDAGQWVGFGNQAV